jgi:hypothetical protein
MSQQYSVGQKIQVRDEDWLVRSTERSADGGDCLFVEGLSPLVKGSTRYFLTKLEENIKVIDPRKVTPRLDKSPRGTATRLYLERP